VDVRSKSRSTKDSLEGYFDVFYINLLRQLLELAGFTCYQREKKNLMESKTTDRKVDLLVRYQQERNILNLEIARNGTGPKVTIDRGKVAMELYHGWPKADGEERLCPPLGVLVYPSESTYVDRNTCVFDVYTMTQVDGVNCLVTLDVFVAPIGSVDIKSRRATFAECREFDASLPGDIDFQRRDKELFVAACEGIHRIVQACNALKKQMDDGQDLMEWYASSEDGDGHEGSDGGHSSSPGEGGDGGSPPSPIDDDDVGPWAPGFTFAQSSGTEAVPVQTPVKTKSTSTTNCCCAQYEIHSILERTDWSEVSLAIHSPTRRRFVCKREQWNKRHSLNDDDELCGNAFDTDVSVFMKLVTACSSCATLVKPVDVCYTDRCIFMEELNEVDWKCLQSNPCLALTACLDILQGVAALHTINVAHCDIKAGAVMARHHGSEDRGSGGDDKCFVLCDFNLAVVNADQFEYSRVPFGSDGWSLRSHVFIRASAKDHDCFSSGLLIATSCFALAREILEGNGDVCYRDSLTDLIETARVNNDQIRQGILEVALSPCLLDISIHDALQKLEILHAGLQEGPRE
jgi:hypothetical protein